MSEHKKISLIKSGIRILGCLLLLFYLNLFYFILSFILAEILGILEEVKEK